MQNLLTEIGRPLAILLVALFLLSATVLTLYFLNFNYGFAKDQATWGTFGDFVGGVLNPILSFFTVLILVINSVSEKAKARGEREKHESEQKLSISLAYQERIAHLLEKIAGEINPLISQYPQPAPKDRGNPQSVFHKIGRRLSLIAHFLGEIENHDPNSPILQYYVRYYRKTIADYADKGYVNANTHQIFHKPRETQSIYFMDD